MGSYLNHICCLQNDLQISKILGSVLPRRHILIFAPVVSSISITHSETSSGESSSSAIKEGVSSGFTLMALGYCCCTYCLRAVWFRCKVLEILCRLCSPISKTFAAACHNEAGIRSLPVFVLRQILNCRLTSSNAEADVLGATELIGSSSIIIFGTDNIILKKINHAGLPKAHDVFFIDGHFLPYYGLNLLAKGWHTVRCQALKGNEIYVVSDIEKRPLMFITEGCEIDFRPIIKRLTDRIISYGINRPVLVFDRGGYGIHFFSELCQYADFVTWGKYIRKEELTSVRQENFTVGLRINDRCYEVSQQDKILTESAATAKKEGRLERSCVNLRMIILREIDRTTGKEKGRRLSVLTCDKIRPLWEIAFFMLNRWGKSENFFKEIMSIFNFNYQPGYAIEEMKHQPLFNNPEVSIIHSAVKSLTERLIK